MSNLIISYSFFVIVNIQSSIFKHLLCLVYSSMQAAAIHHARHIDKQIRFKISAKNWPSQDIEN